MSARKVILHVGAPKTGTSYIEQVIWSQQDRLLERDGIWLPGSDRLDHDAIMGDLRGGVWRSPDNPWTWARVAEAAHERDDVVMVSKEMLAGADAEQVAAARAALGDLEVHVVVGCRALSSSLPSAWQQLVKARDKRPYGAWLDAVRADADHGFYRHHDPISIMRRWAEALPAAQVHVVTVPRSASDPTLLWQRFASAIGVDPDAYETPERPANESLGAIEAEYLRRVNEALGKRLPMREPYGRGVHQPLTVPVLIAAPDKRRFGVPERHADWLAERSQQMIDELSSYPCRLAGDLDDLLPRIDLTLGGPDEVTDAEIAAVAVRATADLLARRAEKRPARPVDNPSPALHRLLARARARLAR